MRAAPAPHPTEAESVVPSHAPPPVESAPMPTVQDSLFALLPEMPAPAPVDPPPLSVEALQEAFVAEGAGGRLLPRPAVPEGLTPAPLPSDEPPPRIKRAAARLGFGTAPYFWISLPLADWRWLCMEITEDTADLPQMRAGWIVEAALDAHTQHDAPRLPLSAFAPGAPWVHKRYIRLSPQHAFDVRLWAQRVGLEPKHLLMALIHWAHTQHPDTPMPRPFSLDFAPDDL